MDVEIDDQDALDGARYPRGGSIVPQRDVSGDGDVGEHAETLAAVEERVVRPARDVPGEPVPVAQHRVRRRDGAADCAAPRRQAVSRAAFQRPLSSSVCSLGAPPGAGARGGAPLA